MKLTTLQWEATSPTQVGQHKLVLIDVFIIINFRKDTKLNGSGREGGSGKK